MKPILVAMLYLLFSIPALSNEIYLNKINKDLDALYNAYDEMCRGSPGGSSESTYGCRKRQEVSWRLKQMGCRNIYPATNPADTSYWKCKR